MQPKSYQNLVSGEEPEGIHSPTLRPIDWRKWHTIAVKLVVIACNVFALFKLHALSLFLGVL